MSLLLHDADIRLTPVCQRRVLCPEFRKAIFLITLFMYQGVLSLIEDGKSRLIRHGKHMLVRNAEMADVPCICEGDLLIIQRIRIKLRQEISL